MASVAVLIVLGMLYIPVAKKLKEKTENSPSNCTWLERRPMSMKQSDTTVSPKLLNHNSKPQGAPKAQVKEIQQRPREERILPQVPLPSAKGRNSPAGDGRAFRTPRSSSQTRAAAQKRNASISPKGQHEEDLSRGAICHSQPRSNNDPAPKASTKT